MRKYNNLVNSTSLMYLEEGKSDGILAWENSEQPSVGYKVNRRLWIA